MGWSNAQRATGFGPVGFERQAEAVMERIRARSRQLWDQAGRPEGREAEFWRLAETEVVTEISLRD